MSRSSGILMPIASLPSPYGIGTLGQAAFDFIDFLYEAGQSWWQILPVGPLSYGDSPYQSPSTFAGNPYFVDLDLLAKDGLLLPEEIAALSWGNDPARIDYGLLYENRYVLLQKASERGWERDSDAIAAFAEENKGWLEDYALFMAVKRHFGMVSWLDWPDEKIRLRAPESLAEYRTLLQNDIRLFTYIQFLFFRQWAALRAYAHEKGVQIIGDLPIYIALDSADVWASPEWFQLDEKNLPVEVSGVPPDYFNENGQLWGNPLYDYNRMREDGYGWWIRRVGGAAKLYDMIRIDHFRGFESYWAIPFGAKDAKNGRWIKGPGMDLVGRITGWFRDIRFIAEDLGYPSPAVQQLLQDSWLPGMKVLEFAFDTRDTSTYLPHSYPTHCVCYTGTHDNAPLIAWKEEARPEDIQKAKQYLGLNKEEGFVWGIIRGGMSSVADLFIAQLPDYLELGAESRINTPGTLVGNWQWRVLPKQLTSQLAQHIRKLTLLYGRCEEETEKTEPKG